MWQEDFARVIYRCLRGIDYQGGNDDQKLKSAINDLAGDFPDEKRFLSFFGDDKFFSMCRRSMTADHDQLPFIVEEVVKHLCNEKFAERVIAERVSGAVTEAFWRLGHPSDDPNGSIQQQAQRQEIVRQPAGMVPSSDRNAPDPKKIVPDPKEMDLPQQAAAAKAGPAFASADPSRSPDRPVSSGAKTKPVSPLHRFWNTKGRAALFIFLAAAFLAVVIVVIANDDYDWNDHGNAYDSWWYDYYSDQPVDKVTKWDEPGPEDADLVAAYGKNILSTNDAIELVEEHFYGDTWFRKGTRDSHIQFSCTDTSEGDYAIDVSYDGDVIWPAVVTDDGRIYCKRDSRAFGKEIPAL